MVFKFPSNPSHSVILELWISRDDDWIFYPAFLEKLLTSQGRTRQIGLRLYEGKFRLDIRKNFFAEKVVRHWNRLQGSDGATTLEVLKKPLDVAFEGRV